MNGGVGWLAVRRCDAMTDLHCHILPGIDDGARSLEVSLAMLKLAADAGTTDIVATPHADYRYRYDRQRVITAIQELRTLHPGLPRLHVGCDFHLYFENIQSLLHQPEQYCIASGPYLLVEFPDHGSPASMTYAFGQMREAGVIPIITHPERTPCLQTRTDLLRAWSADGCLIQVTGASLLGRFGRTAQATAESLLHEDLVHIVASDGHDARHRPPVLQPAYECVRKKWGDQRAESLFQNHPKKVLAGERITLKKRRKSGESRVWFRFGAVTR